MCGPWKKKKQRWSTASTYLPSAIFLLESCAREGKVVRTVLLKITSRPSPPFHKYRKAEFLNFFFFKFFFLEAVHEKILDFDMLRW